MSQERRRFPRLEIIQAFSLFVILPNKGAHRLEIKDLSPGGIGFDVDLVALKSQEEMELRFHINTSLFIPLRIRVVRVVDQADRQRIGAEFLEMDQPQYKAFIAFFSAFEKIAGVVRIASV